MKKSYIFYAIGIICLFLAMVFTRFEVQNEINQDQDQDQDQDQEQEQEQDQEQEQEQEQIREQEQEHVKTPSNVISG